MSDQPPRILCCWPGLAGLWLHGNWSSMLLAIGFSLIFNLALVSTFVWPALIGSDIRWLIWAFVAVTWLISGWISWRFLHARGIDQGKDGGNDHEKQDKTDDTLLIQAQTEYLKGDFTQAELLLAQRLQIESRDAEARLLLAAIYRRSNRDEKALHQLNNLKRLDTASRWQFEIQREWHLIDESREDQSAEDLQEQNTLQDEDSIENAGRGTIKLGEAIVIDDEMVHEDKQTSTSYSPVNKRAA